jgi:hypothetical protein
MMSGTTRLPARIICPVAGLAILAVCWLSGPGLSKDQSPPGPAPSPAVRGGLAALPATGPGTAITANFSTPSRNDPLAGLLRAIDAKTDPMRREALITAAVDAVPVVATRETLARLWDIQGGNGAAKEMVSRLTRRWADGDAPAAAKWLMAATPGPLREIALDQVAIAWASRDMPAVVEWARSMSGDQDGERVVRQVAYEASRTNPVEALGLAVDLPSGNTRDNLIIHACLLWAGTDGEGAAEWAGQIEDRLLRERALAAVATSWAERNPYDAACLAADSLPEGRQQNLAVTAIVERWAQKEPAKAAEWVRGFEEAPLKTTAMNALLAVWASNDPAAMRAWLAQP